MFSLHTGAEISEWTWHSTLNADSKYSFVNPHIANFSFISFYRLKLQEKQNCLEDLSKALSSFGIKINYISGRFIIENRRTCPVCKQSTQNATMARAQVFENDNLC